MLADARAPETPCDAAPGRGAPLRRRPGLQEIPGRRDLQGTAHEADHVTDLNGAKHNLLILTSDVQELWRRFEDVILDLEVRALHAP